MVEVGNKAVVKRTATAKGKIHLQKVTIDLIKRMRKLKREMYLQLPR